MRWLAVVAHSGEDNEWVSLIVMFMANVWLSWMKRGAMKEKMESECKLAELDVFKLKGIFIHDEESRGNGKRVKVEEQTDT